MTSMELQHHDRTLKVCLRWLFSCLLTLLLAGGVSKIAAQQQLERTDLRTPGLVLETECPMTSTMVLSFIGDSKNRTILAAGNDKVVREWKLSGDHLDRHTLKTHRWAAYREQRGCIYSIALSHDQEPSLLAVAGFGLRNGSVAILDRKTGRVLYALKKPKVAANIISLTFLQERPALMIGRSDGTVALWFYRQPDDDILELGRHPSAPTPSENSSNRVLGVVETSPGRLVSIAENGSCMHWDCRSDEPLRRHLPGFQATVIYQVVFSADRRFCAVRGAGNEEHFVSIRDLRYPDIPETVVESTGIYQYHAIALADDDRLLSLVRESDSGKQELVHYRRHETGRYRADAAIGLSGKAEQIALDPTGELCVLASSRGISLYNVHHRVQTDHLEKPGEHIDRVAFSNIGTQFGFQSGDRGVWRVFDLKKQNWASPGDARLFQPVPELSRVGTWKITKKSLNLRVFYLENTQTGEQHVIPTIPTIDLEPQCSLFLKPEPGRHEVRFLIGHQWGASLFEFQPGQGIRLLRRFVGHQSEVTSLGVSADQTRLITGSNDRTISVWDLTHWPYQAELGADFEFRSNRLFVRNVAEGSPAWEAKLQPGDEIIRFAYDGLHLNTPPQQWFRILHSPVPGKEIVFYIKRSGDDDTIVTLTTVRQRPLWRFFATRDNEWVLWRWRDYYYNCSLNGDSLIGWQLNGDVDETPAFTLAEQSRHRFHRPDIVAEILDSTIRPEITERIVEAELLEPRLQLAVSENQNRSNWEITVSVDIPEEGMPHSVSREVWLWLNDQKIRTWQPSRFPFKETIVLSPDQLRAGENHLLAQAYSEHLVRGDSVTENIHSGRAPLENASENRLFALCVGVNNYRQATAFDGSMMQDLLFCREDAQGIAEILRTQQMLGTFRRVDVEVLGDQTVSKQAVIDYLDFLASEADPDDVFVLFLAGHGLAERLANASNAVDPTTFLFVMPNFDARKPLENGLNFFQKPGISSKGSSGSLYDRLADIACHKIVILDCCHSGSVLETNVNLIRCLVPERVGPVIFTSCDRNEQSFPSRKHQHGIFTAAILEAFQSHFEQADSDGNKKIQPTEIARWICERVPLILEEERKTSIENDLFKDAVQTPQTFLPKIVSEHIQFANSKNL